MGAARGGVTRLIGIGIRCRAATGTQQQAAEQDRGDGLQVLHSDKPQLATLQKFTPKTSAAPVASTGGVLGYVEFISERSAEAKQEAHFEGA